MSLIANRAFLRALSWRWSSFFKGRFCTAILKTSASLALAIFLLSSPAVAQEPKQVSVILNIPDWTHTGVHVVAGQTVFIKAQGDLNWYTAELNPPGCPPSVNCHTTPDGRPWSDCQNIPTHFLVPGLNCWSLIGMIEHGQPFQVGSDKQLPADSSGELLLALNDGYYPDNTGRWIAEITTCPSEPALGDLLVYWNGTPLTPDSFVHVAEITATDGSSTVTEVVSKWGPWGLYRHDPDDTFDYGRNWTVLHPLNRQGNQLATSSGGIVTDKGNPVKL